MTIYVCCKNELRMLKFGNIMQIYSFHVLYLYYTYHT